MGCGLALLCCAAAAVAPGVDVLLEELPEWLNGARVGLVTNASGVDSQGRLTADRIHADPRITLVALFAPEHGIRAGLEAGRPVPDGTDPATGIPVYSIYGATKAPDVGLLKDLDALLFDIQDVGARFYTYSSSMAKCMEAAGRAGIPFVVLDRPNPLGGEKIEGWVLEEDFASFIGLYPIPIVHGMTLGELARLFNERFGVGCELHVVRMRGWERHMLFADTGLPWVPPSPNIPSPVTAQLYPGMGLVGEAGVLSVGMGTDWPFEVVGAPWIDAETLAGELERIEMPGVRFLPVAFTPGKGRFAGEECKGVRIVVEDPVLFSPVRCGIHILRLVRILYPEQFLASFRASPGSLFDRAAGTGVLGAMLVDGESAWRIIQTFHDDVREFRAIRKPYLLY